MAEFDGITEQEAGKHKMPVGMIILFWGLIVSGLIYIILFTPWFTGWTQTKQYARKMETPAVAPEEQKATIPAALTDAARIKRGKAVYQAECAVCHGEKLEGGLGPALTGPKFVYGATLEDHVRVITRGTQSGMPKFEKQLGAEKIRNVALFIHTQHTH